LEPDDVLPSRLEQYDIEPDDVLPNRLEQYVSGLNFPASKEEVAAAAESNGAPRDLVQLIRDADVIGAKIAARWFLPEPLVPGGTFRTFEELWHYLDLVIVGPRSGGLPGDWTGEGPRDL
jgi:hypothetical protein